MMSLTKRRLDVKIKGIKTPFERYTKNCLKKIKEIKKEEILKKMLNDIKIKYETEKKEKIKNLETELQNLKK
jgi:hypothetical protein